MIARVSPLIRLGKGANCFDYFAPKELENKIRAGDLVVIPWRRKKIHGVVLEITAKKSSGNFRLRPITKKIGDGPIISKQQLEVIKKFSEYYFISKTSVVNLSVPDIPSRKTKISSLSGGSSRFQIAKEQIPKLKKTAKKIKAGESYIKINDASSFVWLVLYLSNSQNAQTLILLPTIDLIYELAGIIQKKCSANVAVWHSEINKGTRWMQYKKILSGEAKIILSTRQGVFLPLSQKSVIIFFESSSQDFKQYDQNPRYDARVAARWLSGASKSKLIFSSGSPCLFPAKKNCQELPQAIGHSLSVKLSDMKQEMSKKDFSILSDMSVNAIKDTISRNKKVVILSLRQTSENGVSAERLSKALTEKVKNCKIATEYPSKNSFDVLVATPYALESLKLLSERKKIDLAIFASIEPLLAIPDFRSAERVFNRLNFWKILCQELRVKQIILQTYSPENHAIKAFCYGEIDKFKNTENSTRKQFNYPPYSEIIKLWQKSRDAKKSKKAASELKEHFGKNVIVLGPFSDKKSQESILIKIINRTNLEILKKFSKEWVIDRDPENIL